MQYCKLEKTGSTPTQPTPKRSKLNLLLIVSAALLVACVLSAAISVVVTKRGGGGGASSLHNRRPSQAMSKACSRSRYQALCVDSLLDFPGAMAATSDELVHISINMTLQKVCRALDFAIEMKNLDMAPLLRSAYEDCLELLDDSADLLARSLASIAPGGEPAGSTEDVLTWLSAALTNHDTCTEGLDEVGDGGGGVKSNMSGRVKVLSEIMTNSLVMYATSYSDADGEFGGVPTENRRRRLQDFPTWVSRRERALLARPVSAIRFDAVVSKDGRRGAYRTIAAAIARVPDYNRRRFFIYVKRGRYTENFLTIGKKKTNIVLIGDGVGNTVITGSKNVQDGVSTFRSASFAVTGAGFIARSISFENTAGPAKHQAVALRVGADRSVIYRCSIAGYQDSLYVHSFRQFYRECNIYGTVDFIFGNAAVVLQSCTIIARKPMLFQKDTITAQNRQDPTQNTGIIIHQCRLVAEPDLENRRFHIQTFLGRPWKQYSRVVVMLSYLGDHIASPGWLEWDGAFALNTLYYREFMNTGPGSGTGLRVRWYGYRVITKAAEARQFTVPRFLGSSWLQSTGVAFFGGL